MQKTHTIELFLGFHIGLQNFPLPKHEIMAPSDLR